MPKDEERPTREYRHTKMIRLRDEDVERLQSLARRWGVSEAGVFRKALRDASEKEGLE